VGLRRGICKEIAVALPKFLGDLGISQIISPLATTSGQLWARVDAFKLILYPFIEGRDGCEVDLSELQWIAFGTALKKIHSAAVPPAIRRQIPS
jgi:spectinomycin phosphotransferase